jgi:type I restriction enzyme S subunit
MKGRGTILKTSGGKKRFMQAHVAKLTPSLLAKAFRGQLVLQDPNDEPASVLLERIRKKTTAQAK